MAESDNFYLYVESVFSKVVYKLPLTSNMSLSSSGLFGDKLGKNVENLTDSKDRGGLQPTYSSGDQTAVLKNIGAAIILEQAESKDSPEIVAIKRVGYNEDLGSFRNTYEKATSIGIVLDFNTNQVVNTQQAQQRQFYKLLGGTAQSPMLQDFNFQGGMDLQLAIEGDDSKEFHRLFENTLRDGGESSKSDKLQAAAIHCIRQNSLKCLTHIVNKMGQKTRVDKLALAQHAKSLQNAKAFEICARTMTVTEKLKFMNFTPEEFEIAMTLVTQLKDHNGFIEGFVKSASKIKGSSTFCNKIGNRPLALSNITNPYSGPYFPGREGHIAEVGSFVCFPSPITRRFIVYCGRDDSGKTSTVKKITALAGFCRADPGFKGILLVSSSNVSNSNVEEQIQEALGALTGNRDMEQLLNGVWLLTFILKTTGDSLVDAHHSQAVIDYLMKFMKRDKERNLRILVRLPKVDVNGNFMDFMEGNELIHVHKKLPDLTESDYKTAVGHLFETLDDTYNNLVYEVIPRTHYFLTKLKKGVSLDDINNGKGEFVKRINSYKGKKMTPLKRQSSANTPRSYGVPTMERARTGLHQPRQRRNNSSQQARTSPRMPEMSRVRSEGYGYDNYGTHDSFYGSSSSLYGSRDNIFNYEDFCYFLEIIIRIPGLGHNEDIQDKWMQVDVYFCLLVERYFQLNPGDIEFQPWNEKDPTVCRYSVKTTMAKWKEIMTQSLEVMVKKFQKEVELKAKTEGGVYADLKQCMSSMKIEVKDMQKSPRRQQQDYYNPGRTFGPGQFSDYENRGRNDDYYRRGNFMGHGHQYMSTPNMQSNLSSDSQRGKKGKKQNRAHSKNYRQRQDLVQTKRAAVKKILGKRLVDDQSNVYLRGPHVLFIPSKSPNSLNKIAEFVEDIDKDPNVTINKASLPESRKNQFQLKGFLAYLELNSAEEVIYVQKNIYENKYKKFFQKCIPAEFTKQFKSTSDVGAGQGPGDKSGATAPKGKPENAI